MGKLQITVQQWFNLDDKSVRPPSTTCLFSDGVSFWAGWWCTESNEVHINTGVVSKVLESDLPLYWTALENLIAKFEAN